MARIAGVTIPKEKRIEIGLTYIYGVGPSRSLEILERANIDKNRYVKDLTEEEEQVLRTIIADNYVTEGDLRRDTQKNIDRLIRINCYRGTRHRKGLPLRGQKTKTNARTRKGPKKTAASGKKKA